MKQENDNYDEEDSFESDEEMKKYESIITPSTSRTIHRQISIKVKYNALLLLLIYY